MLTEVRSLQRHSSSLSLASGSITMKRGPESFSWAAFREHLSTHLEQQAAHTTRAELIRSNQEFLNTIPDDDDDDDDNLPRLPASEITYQDLKDIFNLHEDLERDLVEIPDAGRFHVPESLEREMTKELGALAHGSKNNLRPCSPIFTPETYLTVEVSHKRMRKNVTADADCSVLYTKHETAPCLVLLEAPSLDSLSMRLVECLTYMAMVQAMGKRQGGQNTAIFGLVSDGRDIVFLEIGNDTKWCQWRPHRAWGPKTKDKIYTVLRLIIRDTMMGSSHQ
ncbi:hypothetical protein ASPCAL10124 [Aspergillus calidoustus]|uniref:Uncharacterized protein n=1 Tax=Aspergillus calidoustus TaxID=454130 RepID=A0A0U5G7P1_ASPCI|nr:hypothetical protein ASPCAL10124 [Aspergillus calidoustus]